MFFEVCQAQGRGFESRPRPFFLCMYLRLCETFLAFSSMSPKGLPSIFSSFAKEWMLKKSQTVTLSHATFDTMRLPMRLETSKNKKTKLESFFPHSRTVEVL